MCWMSLKTPPASQGCTLTGKIALPRSRACTSSAKHHLEASQLGVSSAITAWHWRSLLIERLLPAAAAFDPRLRIEIEEQRSMALCFQPGLHLRRRRVVGAAVADEYRGHLDRQPLKMVFMQLGRRFRWCLLGTIRWGFRMRCSSPMISTR